jgi:ABC-type phosphate/phosphonate transport system substrate-binding protein
MFTSAPSGWSPAAGSTRPRIDSQVLAVEFRDHPQVAASLRVIGSFGPSTIQPVVAASRLPEQLKTAVREVLLGLGGRAEAKSALAQGLVEGFVAIGDRDYDDIRAMLATIHAAGYSTLR